MYSQIAENKRKTIYLLIGFVFFIALLGWVIANATGNPGYMTFLIIFAVSYALIGYFASAKIALTLSKAKPVDKKDVPELYRIVENLAITAGMPTPKIYLVNDPSPNAFATGRDPNHAVVAVTSGLLEIMDKSELEGVIAHELSHVGNYDIRLMSIVVVLVSIVAIISDMFLRWSFFFGGDSDENNEGNGVFAIIAIVAALLAPLIAMLVQLAISRKREYLADASGALLTRYPEGLASALEKIAQAGIPSKTASTATAHLYLTNPFKGKKNRQSRMIGLFSTHPPIEDRINKLKEMEIKV